MRPLSPTCHWSDHSCERCHEGTYLCEWTIIPTLPTLLLPVLLWSRTVKEPVVRSLVYVRSRVCRRLRFSLLQVTPLMDPIESRYTAPPGSREIVPEVTKPRILGPHVTYGPSRGDVGGPQVAPLLR